jgi:GntR family transcriptional repressor for pyruvate dehydrogenase complex
MSSSQGNQNMYFRVSKGSLTEEVVVQIQELVLSGDLRPGDKLLAQRHLATRLGVSPTVVREAVKILEQKGLLEARAGSGTYVSEPTPESCSEVLSLLFRRGRVTFEHLHEIRSMLDIEIAVMAAERAQPQDIEELEDAIRRMDQGLDDTEEYIRADFDLHMALAQATQNPLFPVLTLALLQVLQESRKLIFQVPGAAERGQKCHRTICDCVKHGDVEGAREAMRGHLQQVQRDNAAAQTPKEDTPHA